MDQNSNQSNNNSSGNGSQNSGTPVRPTLTRSQLQPESIQDQPNKNAGDNRNAPGTYPDIDYSDPIQQNNKQALDLSIDPKSPRAADPMNSGVPMTDSDDVESYDGDVIEVEMGGTGTYIFSGILSNQDYNPDLRGWQRIKVFDEMRKGDGTCRLGLLAIKRPLTSAKWFIKPGDGEDDNGPKTTIVREELFQNPNFSWTQVLNQILTFCDYGQSVFEKVMRQRVDGKVGWKKFAQRLPNTIYRYTMRDGKTPGITQILPTGGDVQIPQWKLLMFINELEGANYEGTSMLRPAYPHYYYKQLYYKIDAIASERQGMGVPLITVPPAASPQDKIKARKIARQMRVNQFAYLNLPEGFTFSYVDTKAKELKEVKEMVMHHDREILKAMLAHFLDLGTTQSGSFALADNQSQMFLYSEQYLANIIREQMNIAIRELIDLNFTKTTPDQYPTLEVGRIGQTDLDKLATALFRLGQAGYIVPDEDLERELRNWFDLPEALQTTADQNIDPASLRVPVPNIQPGDIKQRGIIRYGLPMTNAERRQQYKEAMSFMDDILELKDDVENALEAHEK